jgi:hypothetical protein
VESRDAGVVIRLVLRLAKRGGCWFLARTSSRFRFPSTSHGARRPVLSHRHCRLGFLAAVVSVPKISSPSVAGTQLESSLVTDSTLPQ